MKKVLIIDDSVIQIRVIQNILKERYEVLVASTGEEGKKIAIDKKPDLILLDYEMPMFDGKTTFKMIKNHEEIAHIPVVFLTGVNDKKQIESVIPMKPAGYLLKPVEPEKLFDVIERVVASSTSA